MADLGNKIFVLIILYLVAMNWYQRNSKQKNESKTKKLKSLLMAMISEPVNIFIITALILVAYGFSMESLPFFIQETISRLSVIMTPLVLLFIGLAVNIKKQQFFKLLSILFLRAGFAVILCGVLVMVANIEVQGDILLLLVFGLSACSFWPFSHIAVVEAQELEITEKRRTFNASFAVNILALSFPLSTILILAVLSGGSVFSNVVPILLLGSVLIGLGMIPYLVKKIAILRSISEKGESGVDS